MLYPYSRAWTLRQKWFITGAGVFALIVAAAFIYGYEQYLRRNVKETLIDHQWSMQGMDWSSDVTFRRDHTIEVEDGGIGGPYRGKGTWQLHGRNFLELEYELAMVQAPELAPDRFHYRWHIATLTRHELVVDDMRVPYIYKRVK